MKPLALAVICLVLLQTVQAQYAPPSIRTNFVLQPQRDQLRKNLYEYTIGRSLSLPLNTETEYRYQSAFWAVSQFLVFNTDVSAGFTKTLAVYHDSLELETRRSFLEAMYTVGNRQFLPEMKRILDGENHPKLFAMIALWLAREEAAMLPELKRRTTLRLQQEPLNRILPVLKDYLDDFGEKEMVPSIHDLFAHQGTHGYKIVYSFQNRNRDYPGIAIIQHENGLFQRNEDGSLAVFGQLARAASNLPYFITNGNTPQGVYSIFGTDTSGNNFIGPTPNLQLGLPFEYDWKNYFHQPVDTLDPLVAYRTLLPSSWHEFRGIHEAFLAGAIGRTEIIAHGTTIDPEFFRDRPYYPYSPTLGCLCAKEIWDPGTGMLIESEQLKLATAFTREGALNGYYVVLNYFNQQRALLAADILPFVESFEQKFKK